jgi:cytochrome c biogenesis protein CcdA
VIRSQSLALPLAVVVLFIVVADYRRPTFTWRFALVLVPLVVWANVHGSVLLGASLTAIYTAGRAVFLLTRGDRASAARYAVIAFLAAATIFATPYGLDVVSYYTALIGNDSVRRYIQEWAAPTLGDPLSIGYFFMLIATVLVGLYAIRRRYRPPTVLVIATVVLGVLSLTALRFAIWFGLLAALLDANILAGTRPHSRPFPRRFILLIATTFVTTACLAALVVVATPRPEFERGLPTNAMAAVANYAQAHPGSLVLTDELASAFVWHKPAVAGRIGFDTRLEQYDSDSLERWFQFLSVAPPGWPTLIDCYSAILVSSDRPKLTSALTSLPGWSVLASEPAGTAFVRLDPGAVMNESPEAAPPGPGSDPTVDSASRCAQPRGSAEP